MTYRTHWEECWREHHECAVKMIENLMNEINFQLICFRDYRECTIKMMEDFARLNRSLEESQARIAELEAKLAAYERADAAMLQALNEGDGVYRP
jgi:hypothetical protein